MSLYFSQKSKYLKYSFSSGNDTSSDHIKLFDTVCFVQRD